MWALPEAVNAFGAEVKNAGAASPEREGNWAKSGFDDLVQYNDGFRSNLIGTPQQIAERILDLKDTGADLILLAFLHFQEEVAYSASTCSRWYASLRRSGSALPLRPNKPRFEVLSKLERMK